MKSISKYIMCIFALMLGLTACDKNDDCTLDLNGNCLIEEIALDGYAGIIDLPSHSIVVRLPEGTPCNAMKVTSLRLTEGATHRHLHGHHRRASKDHHRLRPGIGGCAQHRSYY